MVVVFGIPCGTATAYYLLEHEIKLARERLSTLTLEDDRGGLASGVI